MDHDGPADWDGDADPGYPAGPGDDGGLDTPLGGEQGEFAAGDDPDSSDGHDFDAGHDETTLDADVTAHHGGDLGYSYSDYEQEPPSVADDDTDGPDDADHGYDPLPEPVSGAHPDLDPVGDDPAWAADYPFPPQLDVGEPPEPVDGFPWSDPAVLGEAHDTGLDSSAEGPPADDLLAYDAYDLPAGDDPWAALAGSDDPATSSLARWWAPEN